MASAERISAKQYGVRYGRRLREKIGKIEKARRENSCPYCHCKKIKRVSSGIWLCKKCENKFTGRAYVIGKKLEAAELEKIEKKAVPVEEPQKEEEEEKEPIEA